MKITINIAKEFSNTPGARFKTDGLFSTEGKFLWNGEEFRETFLEKYFQNPKDDSKILIELDGTEGYPTSFLEEAFGGLARKFGIETCLKKLEFISSEEKMLIDEIRNYIEKAND